ncbi:MAG: 4a-hydroxytetrahydrobiopterin dehydratase [Bacteroidota bacterium]
MEKLNPTQIETQLTALDGWTYDNGSLGKTYIFDDFKAAFSAMTRIAFECEAMNHHPNWENVYNRLAIQLNTHDAGGVTELDFELAQKIEGIVNAN